MSKSDKPVSDKQLEKRLFDIRKRRESVEDQIKELQLLQIKLRDKEWELYRQWAEDAHPWAEPPKTRKPK